MENRKEQDLEIGKEKKVKGENNERIGGKLENNLQLEQKKRKEKIKKWKDKKKRSPEKEPESKGSLKLLKYTYL